MKILYCSNVCSEETYRAFFAKANKKPGQQVQKYHRVLLKGFAYNKDVDIKAISKLSIQRDNTKKIGIKGFREKWNGINIKYLPTCNLPRVGQLIQVVSAFFSVFFEKAEKDTIAILDVLNVSMGMGILKACHLRGIKVIGIITDLPEMLSEKSNDKFVNLCHYIISKCDGYVVLTKEMNSVVNKNEKPYVVIEGQVDSKIELQDEDNEKYRKKVCLYSGSLNRIHGIPYLVEGFLKADIHDSELHIYGNGDYEEELLSICRANEKIKYFGVRLNDEVVQAQQKATLLINPRPTNQEFVKYSFPSKNMEYMVSGTPMLTTRLPGMPEEYYPYVYILDEENAAGMASALNEILSQDSESLRAKGLKAKHFVLCSKTGEVQARKILLLAQLVNS